MTEPPEMAPGASTTPPRRRGSLITKATAIVVIAALTPVGFVSLWLTSVYRASIETAEKQLQTSALAEIAGAALRGIGEAQVELEAIASALSIAVNQPDQEAAGILAAKSLLATRRQIQAVRLEVPAANVSTVLRRQGTTPFSEPESSPDLRRLVDERGAAFAVIGPGAGLAIVGVPGMAGDKKGYVTARVELGQLEQQLKTIAQTRFDARDVHIAIADRARRLVAGYGLPALPNGDASALAVWHALPTGTPWQGRVALVSEHVQDGVRMVGAIETVPQLGWALAIWRPRSTAYAALWTLTQRFQAAAIVSLIGAMLVGVLAARRLAEPIVRLSQQAKLIGQRRWRQLSFSGTRNDEIGELSRSIQDMATQLEQGELELQAETKLRTDLSRFMSRELVDSIVSGQHSLELGGKHAEITVLFADVVAFTPLAESHAPEQVVKILNELFGMLSEVVFRHHGTVDKFIGDCIMAVWGVPFEQPDHATRALAAAEEMLRFLEVANEDWKQRFNVQLRLAIGVNSGSVIVGNIGSRKRMEYTVIGDVVNVAARLESIAKPNQVLVAQRAKELSASGFTFTPLGEHRLTGRASQTSVYELVVN